MSFIPTRLVAVAILKKFTGSVLAPTLIITLLLGPFPVYAALCAMNTTVGAASATCGEVFTFGTVEFESFVGLPSPGGQNFVKGPAGGTAVSIGLAPMVSGIGTASAQVGLLRATAVSLYSNADRNGFISTRVTTTFTDTGPITAVGLAAGTVVHATATWGIDGTASRGAGILSSALLIGSNLNNNLLGLSLSPIYHFDLHVGEIVTLFLGLQVFADASFSTPAATADYGHSARLFLDFAESGVRFDSMSQHDYRTGAIPTPVPAAFPLFAAGLGALRVVAKRRKRSVIVA